MLGHPIVAVTCLRRPLRTVPLWCRVKVGGADDLLVVAVGDQWQSVQRLQDVLRGALPLRLVDHLVPLRRVVRDSSGAAAPRKR